MAATEEGLDFLEGNTLDSKLHASRGQRSIKKSSTVKKTKRKTLARDPSKSQPSAKGARNRPFGMCWLVASAAPRSHTHARMHVMCACSIHLAAPIYSVPKC